MSESVSNSEGNPSSFEKLDTGGSSTLPSADKIGENQKKVEQSLEIPSSKNQQKGDSLANSSLTNDEESREDQGNKNTSSKRSNELQALLALSKEANLDVNISHKRKSVETSRMKESKEANRVVPKDVEISKKKTKVLTTCPGSDVKPKFPVTAEAELENVPFINKIKSEINNTNSGSGSGFKNNNTDGSSKSIFEVEGATRESDSINKTRLSRHTSKNMDNVSVKMAKDRFCWRCHREGVNISCETCPRSYHQKCLKQSIGDSNHWPCPECVAILKAENVQTRSEAMKGMTLEHLCSLLKFALKRMIHGHDSQPFIDPVSEAEFPEYKKYIVQPMHLSLLERNIKDNVYGSTQAFEADAKWIFHNSCIFNTPHSKLTSTAKSIIKTCKQEMSEIENCPSCYLNANTKSKTWFVEACPKPHILVWAKLKGFPYWPAKAMSTNSSDMVDVRFFGAHDRAWVPLKECFLYCRKDPNSHKYKKNDIEECVKELEVHISNLRKVYGEFYYAPFKTPFDPSNELKQLQIFFPHYKSDSKPKARQKLNVKSDCSNEDTSNSLKDSPGNKNNSDAMLNDTKEVLDSTVEGFGYGTDDESFMGNSLNNEQRRRPISNYDSDGENGEEKSDIDGDMDVEREVEKEVQQVSTSTTTTTSNSETIVPKEEIRSSKTDKTKEGLVKITKKRSSADDILQRHSSKLKRRNSDQNVNNDAINIKSVEKINKLEMLENMEVSFEDEIIDSTNSQNSSILSKKSKENDSKAVKENDFKTDKITDPDTSKTVDSSETFEDLDLKNKPIQIDVNNSEYIISAQGKLKISDRLMKKLMDTGDLTKSKSDESLKVTSEINPSSAISVKVAQNSTSLSTSPSSLNLTPDASKDKVISEKESNPDKNTSSIKISPIMETSDKNKKADENKGKVNKTEESTIVVTSSEEATALPDTNTKDSPQTEQENQLDSNTIELSGSINNHSKPKVAPVAKKASEFPIIPDSISNEKSQGPSEINSNVQETKNPTKSTPTVNDPLIEDKSSDESNSQIPMIECDVSLEKLDDAEIRNIIHSSLNTEIPELNPTISVTGSSTPSQSELIENKKRKLDDRSCDDPSNNTQPNKYAKITTDESIKENSKRSSQITCNATAVTSLNENIKSKDPLSCSNDQKSTGSSDSQDQNEKEEPFIELPLITEIKSEPESDTEMNDSAYMERKRSYMSALNISERQDETCLATVPVRPAEMRTRSRTGEIITPIKPVDNLSRVIDSVAKNCISPLQVKSLAEMRGPPPKQKARKSFPTPDYSKPGNSFVPVKLALPSSNSLKKPVQLPVIQEKEQVMSSTQPPIINQSSMINQVVNIPQSPMISSGSLFIVTPSSSVTNNLPLLPPNQTISYSVASGNPIVATPGVMITSGSLKSITPSLKRPDLLPKSKSAAAILSSGSQNYIPQKENSPESSSVATINNLLSSNNLLNSLLTTTKSSDAPVEDNNEEHESTIPATPDEFAILNSVLPSPVTSTVNALMSRPPPKLKPRPPGPLSETFDEGVPSSAGTATSQINSIAHRLTDYFRGMLIETLDDLGKSNNNEATVAALKLEIETLKHNHTVELNEIKKNICTTFKDLQKSIVEERERIVQETRTACETETIKRVEEAKSKQWCANCFKEAQFYCCWNTSYCDYPCQQKHWTKHIGKCTQNASNPSPLASNTRPTYVIRTAHAKDGKDVKRIVGKPTKVYLNRSMGTKSIYKAPSSGQLTLVESTPGNFELQGVGPVSVPGKLLPSMVNKLKTIVTSSVSSSSPNSCGVFTYHPKLYGKTIQTPQLTNKNNITTLSSDDSD